MEENPPWKIIRSLERKINWPRNWPILPCGGDDCQKMIERLGNNIISRASEIGEGRQTNIGSVVSDERKGYR